MYLKDSKLFRPSRKKIRVKKRFNNCIDETLKFFGPRKKKLKSRNSIIIVITDSKIFQTTKKKIRVHEQYNFCIQGTLTFSRETKKKPDFLKVSSLFKNCILRRNRVRICSFVSRNAAMKARRHLWLWRMILRLCSASLGIADSEKKKEEEEEEERGRGWGWGRGWLSKCNKKNHYSLWRARGRGCWKLKKKKIWDS